MNSPMDCFVIRASSTSSVTCGHFGTPVASLVLLVVLKTATDISVHLKAEKPVDSTTV